MKCARFGPLSASVWKQQGERENSSTVVNVAELNSVTGAKASLVALADGARPLPHCVRFSRSRKPLRLARLTSLTYAASLSAATPGSSARLLESCHITGETKSNSATQLWPSQLITHPTVPLSGVHQSLCLDRGGFHFPLRAGTISQTRASHTRRRLIIKRSITAAGR